VSWSPKPPTPRYLGGWDFARWASAADPLERARIEGLTQFVRIPRQLDLVDQISKNYGTPNKLANSRLFWVTHLKADIAPLARAFLEAGLKASDATVVSSPYGNSDAVRDTLTDLGFPVTVPPLKQVNHDGDAEGIPPRRFQVTDAALLAGVFQASSLESGTKGPLPLDQAMDTEILTSYQRLEKEAQLGGLESFDPRRFMEIAAEVAGRFVLPEPQPAGLMPPIGWSGERRPSAW